MLCKEKRCNVTAAWVWEEYDDRTPVCQAHMLMMLEELVLGRTVAQIDVEGPDRGRPGTIRVDK